MAMANAMRTPLVWAMAMIMLAACVGPAGRQAEPMSTFTLEAALASKSPDRDGPVLLVAAPQARPGFDTARMAYVRQANEIDYFARHRWIDSPARMLAPLLVQSLEATGNFSAVLLAPTVARTQWRLETEIVKMQQEFLQVPSRAHLVLRAQLIEVSSQRAVASRLFDVSVAAGSEDARGGVQAMNAALNQALQQLAHWASESTHAARH